MDASLNESMLLDVKVSFRKERLETGPKKPLEHYRTTYTVAGNLPLDDLKSLLKTCAEKDLTLRTEFGQAKVRFENLDYKADSGDFLITLLEE